MKASRSRRWASGVKGKAYETVVRPGAMHGLEKIFTDQKKVKMTVAEILETLFKANQPSYYRYDCWAGWPRPVHHHHLQTWAARICRQVLWCQIQKQGEASSFESLYIYWESDYAPGLTSFKRTWASFLTIIGDRLQRDDVSENSNAFDFFFSPNSRWWFYFIYFFTTIARKISLKRGCSFVLTQPSLLKSVGGKNNYFLHFSFRIQGRKCSGGDSVVNIILHSVQTPFVLNQ